MAIRRPPILHNHSKSCTISARRAIISAPPGSDLQWSKGGQEKKKSNRNSQHEPEAKQNEQNIQRCKSAQALQTLQDAASEDKLTIVVQIFWIAVSMLESDLEHEFLLAAQLLDEVLEHVKFEHIEYREKLDKVLQQLKWTTYPGVQALLLKGCTLQTIGADITWKLLPKLTEHVSYEVVVADPLQPSGFALNVIAQLPQLVCYYEDPPPSCITAAEIISKECLRQNDKLENLATVMTLYSRGTFARDSLQWTKCVLKYLYDVYSHVGSNMVILLVEV